MFGCFRRSQARPDADRPLGQRFDLLLKAFASPCALLLGMQSKIVEAFLFHVFVDEGAVGGLSFGRVVASSVYCSCGVMSGVCCPSALWG